NASSSGTKTPKIEQGRQALFFFERVSWPSMTASAAPLRLMSCNIQAGSSTRAYREYVTRSWAHLLPNGKRANLDSLAQLFSPFDVVGLQESDPGSLRSGFDNQSDYLAERAHFPYFSHQSNRRMSGI